MAVAALFPALATMAAGSGAAAAGLSTASMVMAGLQVAGSVMGAIEATKQANSANKQLAAQTNAANELQRQESQQMTDQMQSQMGRVAQQALAERNRLYTQASEAGVSGGVLERLAMESQMNQDQAYQDLRDQNQTNQFNLYNQGAARVNSARKQIDANVSQARSAWINSGLKIAGIGMGLEAQGNPVKK